MLKMKRLMVVAMVAIMAVAMLTGCTAQDLRDRAEASDQDQLEIVLYFSNDDASGMVREERTVPASDRAHELVVLEELIAGPKGTDARRTLPAESGVHSVEVKDGVAFVDFTQSTADNHVGGSAGDQMAIESVVFTLTEINGIDAVQFLVEGEIVESIFGHVATDSPISR